MQEGTAVFLAKAIFEMAPANCMQCIPGTSIVAGPLHRNRIDEYPSLGMKPTVMFMSGEVELAKQDIEYLWGFVANPDEQEWLIW